MGACLTGGLLALVRRGDPSTPAWWTPTPAFSYTGGLAGEPTVSATGGYLFFSGLRRLPGTISAQAVNRLRLADATWRDVSPSPPADQAADTTDPYLHADASGRVYAIGLYGRCPYLYVSDGRGAQSEHWRSIPYAGGCGHPGGFEDFPKIVSGPWGPCLGPHCESVRTHPNATYWQMYDYPVAAVAAVSTDGGLSFGPYFPLFRDGDCANPTKDSAIWNRGTAHRGAVAPDGTVYVAKGHCGALEVARSVDSGTTWHRLPPVDNRWDTLTHNVTVGGDATGQVYVFWRNEGRLWLAVGRDAVPAFAWSARYEIPMPAGVSRPVYPVMVVGDADPSSQVPAGRLAFAYYGRTEASDRWDAYLGYAHGIRLTDDGLGGLAVSVERTSTLRVNPESDPIARTINNLKADGLLDFIDVTLDADGRPWAAYVDICTSDECRAPGGRNNPECLSTCANTTFCAGSVCNGINPGRVNVGLGFVGTFRVGPRLKGPVDQLPPLAWTLDNQPPWADAGHDFWLPPGAYGQLDGRRSGDPGEPSVASFDWEQIDGPPVSNLSYRDTAQPTFLAPLSSGRLTFRLTVRDAAGLAASDTVDVVVSTVPPPD